MVDQNYHAGRLIAIFLYVVQGIFVTVALTVDPKVNNWIPVCLLVAWCITFWEITRMTNERGVTSFAFCIFTCLSSLVNAVVLTYIYKTFAMIVVVYMVQCIVVICFRLKRSAVVIGLAMIFTLMQFAVAELLGIIHFIKWMEFAVLIIGILISMWAVCEVVDLIQTQEKRFAEQERSLDDMLHIVEVMCDEARAGTKSKSAFLSNMSHEIRTPINSMLGMNEMIMRECKDENIRRYAQNIETSGNMLLSLVNDILDFSKVESGKMELVYVEYHLSAVLNDLINMISNRLQEKHLDFIVDVDPTTPECLMGDEMRIKQILTNLLTNAAKYTDEGSVTLKVYPEMRGKSGNVRICFEVIDTGRGIRLQDQEHLFDAFRRVDEKKNRNIEGTGLGLAIASDFTALMNGVIGVENEYGRGSVFYVRIPQVVTEKQTIGNYSERIKLKKNKSKEYDAMFVAPDAKILVVDDNEMNLTVVAYLLKHNKVQITKATGGWQAVELLRQQQFDLVLLDHMMPELDGVDALKIMKAENLVEQTPVIALTANAIAGSREKYLSLGFSDYLSKPISGADLEKCFMKWLPQEKIILSE